MLGAAVQSLETSTPRSLVEREGLYVGRRQSQGTRETTATDKGYITDKGHGRLRRGERRDRERDNRRDRERDNRRHRERDDRRGGERDSRRDRERDDRRDNRRDDRRDNRRDNRRDRERGDRRGLITLARRDRERDNTRDRGDRRGLITLARRDRERESPDRSASSDTLGTSTSAPKYYICLRYKSGDVATVDPCRHSFDYDCVMPWLKHSNKCPKCRRKVETAKWRLSNGRVKKQKLREWIGQG